MPLVYADSPLFAPTDAIPAVVAAAHTHALTLALGSCVPALHASLLFVAPCKAILVFFNRKLYLPWACGEAEDVGNVNSK